MVGVGCWLLVRAGIGASALFIVAAPAMLLVGMAMVISPGDDHGHHCIDFTDWFELLPRGRRVLIYLLGVGGLGAGIVLLLWLGGWSFDGVFDLVF